MGDQWEAFRRRARWKAKVAQAARLCLMEPSGRSRRGRRHPPGELRTFCRADVTCVVVGKDGHRHPRDDGRGGRREVWTRLRELLDLDDQAIREIMKEANDA